MKSFRVIYILFLFAGFFSYANDLGGDSSNLDIDKAYIDSLFNKNNRVVQSEKDAKKIINEYDKAINEGFELAEEDLKKLAISYAVLDDSIKASHYIDSYIRSTSDRDFLYSNSFESIKKSEEYLRVYDKYTHKIDGWILFFFTTGLLGIFISLVLNLRKKGDIIANLLISSFVLLHSLFVIYICLFLSNYVYDFPHSLRLTTSFSFLYGPLLYFYFKRISGKYRFKKQDLLHLIPTIVLIIHYLPIYSLSYKEKLHALFNKEILLRSDLNILIVLKIISLVVYTFLIFKVYKVNFKKKLHNKSISVWKKNILILNTLYVITYIAYGISLMKMSVDVFRYPQIFMMCIIVLYVAYTAYVQPRVFSKKYLFEEFVLKYRKSGLTESYSLELKEQLLTLLNKEKIFRINDLNLNGLSEVMGTTRHNLSQVINEHFDMNFFNLVNKYRIQEAQEILLSDQNRNINIIDVAYDVGFNNKVTFNKAFKEQTNLTPSQFLKQNQKPSLKVNLR